VRPVSQNSSPDNNVVKEYMIDLARVKLVFDPAYNYRYIVEYPPITEKEKKLIDRIIREIIEKDMELEEEIVKKYAEKRAKKLYKKYTKKKPEDEDIEKIVYYVVRDTVGFGKLDVPMKDPNIEDIHISGYGKPVYVWYVKIDLIPTNIYFEDEVDAMRHIQKLLVKTGKYISYTKPIVDGNIGPGFRVHIIHKAVSPDGTQVVIRKHKKIPFSVIDLIKSGVAPPEVFAYLWLLVEYKRSILIIGETAAGKTTLLNAICTLIPLNMKIVSVEEVRELRLPHDNVSYLTTKESVDHVGRVTLFDLVKAALRQRPNYIIVGEIRGEEAFALFQAMTVGHGGLATMHADEPESAIRRLMMKPLNIPPHMIRELDAIVAMAKYEIKREIRRYVVRVSELIDIKEDNTPVFFDVYRAFVDFDGNKKEIMKFEESHVLRKIAESRGLDVQILLDELKARAEFLRELANNGAKYNEVIKAITEWKNHAYRNKH